MKEISETGGELDYDTGHFRKNGSQIPLHVNMKMVKWEEKNVLLTIATDLTERKKAENLLKQKNLFLQQLIDAIPIPIFTKTFTAYIPGAMPLLRHPLVCQRAGSSEKRCMTSLRGI